MRNALLALAVAAVFLGGCCAQSWYVYRECDLIEGRAASDCGVCEHPCRPGPAPAYTVYPAPPPGAEAGASIDVDLDGSAN